jgi:hypothetical protein
LEELRKNFIKLSETDAISYEDAEPAFPASF